jgi:hypothetical protein
MHGTDDQDVLNRRSDLSSFVVHLTKHGHNGSSAADNLRSIIRERRLCAATPMGWARTEDGAGPAMQSQRAVSFSETPLEHAYSLFADIEGRSVQLQPYGLALTKVVARLMGIQPVWYVDMTTRGGREWEEARALDQLREEARATGHFHQTPAAKLLPYFDWMGVWPERRKEFWWEREWRHRGDVDLVPYWDRIIWLCPAEEHGAMRDHIRRSQPVGASDRAICIDPSWGIEQALAHLCGFPPEDVTLFHASAGDSREDRSLPARLIARVTSGRS